MSDEPTDAPDAPDAPEGSDAPAVLTTDAVLAALPVGSRAEWVQTATGPVWNIYRGAGLSEHGTGATAARAVRVIGAQLSIIPGLRHPQLVDANGDVIAPE